MRRFHCCCGCSTMLNTDLNRQTPFFVTDDFVPVSSVLGKVFQHAAVLFLPHYNSKQSCTRNRWQSDSHVAVVERRRILLSLTLYECTASPKKHRKNNLDDYSLGFLMLCTLSPRHSTTCFLFLSHCTDEPCHSSQVLRHWHRLSWCC